jgi:subtilisin family serine protease
MSNRNQPTDDPLSGEQWWLYNTGQRVTNNAVEEGGIPGLDLNVTSLWPTYTGKGIKVGVVDRAIDATQEDLKGNLRVDLSQPNFAPTKPDDNHGTAVAGIIAAARNNTGTVGIAYEAQLGSWSFGDSVASWTNMNKLDISNNSWGDPNHKC